MRVIICGAGQVGYGIAERLAAEQNDVTVIDISPDLIFTIRDELDVRGLVGHGSHPDMLAAAGADEADMLIAVTLHDEINMVACQVAHSLFAVPTKFARVRSQAYLDPRYQDLFSRENLPIDVVISPEIEVGRLILRRLAEPGALDVLSICDGKVLFLAISCSEDCPLINTPLRQLSSLFPDLQATAVGIKRNGKLFIPQADDELNAGDIVYITVLEKQVRRTMALFGHEEQEARRIIIAGGGHIGLYVAQEIEKQNHPAKVKIIEFDKERALYITDRLKKTPVLHGSALDQEVLQEAGAETADLIVTLTNQDQVNILSAMMAKRLGTSANMVLINDPVYEEFTRTDGIDAHINPRNATISKVLQHVRRGRIRAVHSISDGKAELLEVEAVETSPLVGKTIKELTLSNRLRIGAIYRKDEIIRPTGDLRLQPKDRIVIFALAEAVKEVEQMFRVSFEFF
ncbi:MULTISPECIES: Trk system potassium transporter TrkA [unclassified Bartonella]|uniref:Trk system potassium transporter TrkA n=1 Tax=unclassified Bartonella TaxID=2645622 RepID=UPI0015FC5BA5|nr:MULTISPECIES: Trk system potassium transporter TrkA [unclassified Bartonella]UXN04449.1 Trk system potassium transporter TrkA [Bartonella sp. HY406]UXN07443.1 Trk system potassium transporter TrkA [Bartonella sp. HY761]